MLHCHEQFPESDFIYYYIGDNPQKDFLVPNQLGWESVCLLDDGSNIHEQVFDMEKGYLPTGMIRQMNEILNNVKDGY
jgi:putative hydrolase of the HAD superfamily